MYKAKGKQLTAYVKEYTPHRDITRDYSQLLKLYHKTQRNHKRILPTFKTLPQRTMDTNHSLGIWINQNQLPMLTKFTQINRQYIIFLYDTFYFTFSLMMSPTTLRNI